MNEQFTSDIDRRSGRNVNQQRSTVGLVKQLLNEVSDLFRKEIALAKVEASDALSNIKTGAISMASGGAVLFAGFLVLLAAAVLALSHVVPDWLAALIVGAIVTVIGFIMVQGGKTKLDTSKIRPERTERTLRQSKETVERRMA